MKIFWSYFYYSFLFIFLSVRYFLHVKLESGMNADFTTNAYPVVVRRYGVIHPSALIYLTDLCFFLKLDCTRYTSNSTQNQQNLMILWGTAGVNGNDALAPKPWLNPDSSFHEGFVVGIAAIVVTVVAGIILWIYISDGNWNIFGMIKKKWISTNTQIWCFVIGPYFGKWTEPKNFQQP